MLKPAQPSLSAADNFLFDVEGALTDAKTLSALLLAAQAGIGADEDQREDTLGGMERILQQVHDSTKKAYDLWKSAIEASQQERST